MACCGIDMYYSLGQCPVICAALFGQTIMLEQTAHEQQFHTVSSDQWEELFKQFAIGTDSALAQVLEVRSMP